MRVANLMLDWRMERKANIGGVIIAETLLRHGHDVVDADEPPAPWLHSYIDLRRLRKIAVKMRAQISGVPCLAA